jgi:hypothetical protein
MVKGRVALGGVLAVLALLGGCNSQEKLQDEQQNQILAWLPGHYNNIAQAQVDTQTGVSPPHERIALTIRRVYAPRLGHHIFYMQETAADDPRRVMSGRLLGVEINEKRGIVSSLYTFVEPQRWRDGAENPELFTVVMPEDVQGASGCEIVWKKTGDHFVGSHDPHDCSDTGVLPGGEPLAVLTSSSLNLAGYHFGKAF